MWFSLAFCPLLHFVPIPYKVFITMIWCRLCPVFLLFSSQSIRFWRRSSKLVVGLAVFTVWRTLGTFGSKVAEHVNEDVTSKPVYGLKYFWRDHAASLSLKVRTLFSGQISLFLPSWSNDREVCRVVIFHYHEFYCVKLIVMPSWQPNI